MTGTADRKKTLRMFNTYFTFFLFPLLLLISAHNTQAEKIVIENIDKLPTLNVDTSKISVSGISSGAFMASQLHVAFSKKIMGAGMVAGGPFLCAGTQFTQSHYGTFVEEFAGSIKAMSICMNPCMTWDLITQYNPFLNKEMCQAVVPSGLKPNVSESLKIASNNPNIDSLDNLKNDNVYLFTGDADFVVATEVVAAAKAFYQGAKVNNIRFSDDKVNAGHSFVTQKRGHTKCQKTAIPFINTCKNIDQAEELLETIYGELSSPSNAPYDNGNLYSFDQTRYLDQSKAIGMFDKGFIYVPKKCSNQSSSLECPVHIALHGCMQSDDVIGVGTKFVTEAGYNAMAASNNIIVVYPQVKSFSLTPLNPMGCWDFWGYTGSDFYNKKAPQMQAIMNMVDSVIGHTELASQ